MVIALVLMIVPLILFVFAKSGQKVTALPGDPVGKSSLALVRGLHGVPHPGRDSD